MANDGLPRRPSKERTVANGAPRKLTRGSTEEPRPRLTGPTAASPSGDRVDDNASFAGLRLGALLAHRYRIVELLGEGGMGAVYRAHDLTLGEDVAVKLLAPELADDPARVDYFRNEVLLARRVTHPNVCRLHDIACDDGLWFITMEHIEGESLAERLSRGGGEPTDRGEIERIFVDVANGLAAAHAAGVVHRDLKPANVLICADSGRAVVADFGIAVELNQLGSAEGLDQAGTRGYMSPEQAAGGDIDARTDVFALGVLGHRLLTGTLPEIAPTVLGSQRARTDLDPQTLPPGHSPSLSSVVARCLEAKPAERPSDAGDVLALLTKPSRRSRHWRTALLAFTVCGVAAAALMTRSQTEAQTEPLMFGPPRVVVGEVDVSTLDPSLHWYAEAFGQRLANELEDAWGVPARTNKDTGEELPNDLRVALQLRRRDNGELNAEFRSSRQGVPVDGTSDAPSFQGLAEAVAGGIMERVPTGLTRPHPIELQRNGIATPKAWRLWRRAQRASLRQQWIQSGVLAKRALDADPDCIPCLIELGWSYGAQDSRRLPMYKRAIELASDQSLTPSLRRVLDFVAADLVNDRVAMSSLLTEVLDVRWSHHDRRYYSFRAFARLWFEGYREAAAPQLEMHVELFSRTSGVAKMLAEHFLELDGREESKQALRYATIAVANGPDDVAARAQLARALVREDRREDALTQVEIIESAESLEKQQAFAGGDRTNALFDLYMALGDRRGAAQAARRLYNGAPSQKATASESLGHLAYLRGDHVRGDRLHREAQRRFEEIGDRPSAAIVAERRIWIQFSAGKCDRVRELISSTGSEYAREHHPVIELLCRYISAGRPSSSADLVAAAEAVNGLRDVRRKALLGLVIAVEREDWKRALEHEDLVRLGRNWISAYRYLGIAAEKAGDLERASRWHELLAEHRFAWISPLEATASRLDAARLREALGQEKRAIEHLIAYVAQLDQAPPNHVGLTTAKKRLQQLEL